MEKGASPITSHASILAIFIVMLLFLSIPLIIFSSQTNQDIRQRAAKIPTSESILQPEGGNGYISGYVFIDENRNGERDFSEKSAEGVQLKIIQVDKKAADSGQASNLTAILTTDANGYFIFKFPYPFSNDVLINVELVLPEGYKTVNTNPIKISGVNNSTKQIISLGIYAVSNELNINSGTR